jgi:hypothetical protein
MTQANPRDQIHPREIVYQFKVKGPGEAAALAAFQALAIDAAGEQPAFNRDSLDPGIRLLVCWLRARGFETTDSGDGISKDKGPALGTCSNCDAAFHDCPNCTPAEVLSVPHVHMMSTPETLIADAQRLHADLRAAGIEYGPGTIAATFDPNDGSAVLSLWGVDDANLMATKWAQESPKCKPHGHLFCEVCLGELEEAERKSMAGPINDAAMRAVLERTYPQALEAEASDWPPGSDRCPSFGHANGCAPPKDKADAGKVEEWGCVPGCPALEAAQTEDALDVFHAMGPLRSRANAAVMGVEEEPLRDSEPPLDPGDVPIREPWGPGR